jgi:YbbR domain-containing protein
LKAVPIVVDYQGNPAVNYALTSLSSDPFLVEVAGPAEALSNILSVRTAPLNLTGKTSSFQQSVTLISPSENVSLSVTQANVSVEIEQIESRYTFNDVLIELRGTSPDFSYILNPERVNVTIRGGLGGISGASTDEIRPRVDLDRLGAGIHNIRVTVALPSGVRLDSVEPSMIEITITQQTPETPEPPPGDEPGDSAEPSEQPDETNGSE